MKIYICSHINVNSLKTTCNSHLEAMKQLYNAGHDGVSATNAIWDYASPVDEIRNRLKLLYTCEAILVLPNWQDDPVARLEVATAHTMGIDIIKANNTILNTHLTFYLNPTEFSND